VLATVLEDLPQSRDSNVLVGFESADDAGVYLLNEEQAIVQSVDFFTPVVDDPGIYGAIAAANSLSDLYAMGAKPLFALSVVGFPSGVIETSILTEIVRGGAGKMVEAGVPVIGGHSVQDPEIKFGYCVTGLLHPDRIWTNTGARAGDLLFLSKPLGTGIITTGVKYGKTSDPVLAGAIEVMTQLNRETAEVARAGTVHGATDITGYGFAGHAFELAKGSGVTLSINTEAVPILPGTRELARRGLLPGGIMTNRDYVGDTVSWGSVDELHQNIFLDPQTSGGLLLSVPEESAARLQACATLVGRVEPRGNHLLKFG